MAQQQWGGKDIGINTNAWSDSIDILHYDLHLDMTQYNSKFLQGHCQVHFHPKQAHITNIKLHLLQFHVDSVWFNQQKVNYHYNDTLLIIPFPTAVPPGKKSTVTVFYQGIPQQDASWGGFYFNDGFAFNLGVGFTSNPHNYGRVWHPCFDNFQEKATYTFHIATPKNRQAHCNGFLLSARTQGEKTTYVWKMEDPIPTYLACVAIADYTTVKRQYIGQYDTIPIELAARVKDTANLLQSFQHLTNCLAAYEYWFGPHRWNKVGYSLVPFRSGAMEHATNIAYPIIAANGTLRRETLMAHELGHSWWGNNITCQTANDMWINEGMASYCEQLFLEYTYGRERYIQAVKKNHHTVLKYAHQREGGYRPIAQVPFKYTYGMHVYDKGAVVMHNMRHYLGDSLFRKGMQHLQEKFQFQTLNSIQYRDELSKITGVNMTAFFDNWVFTGGYPHFSISQYSVQPNDQQYQVHLKINQRLLGRSSYHQHTPVEVSFFGSDWQQQTISFHTNPHADSTITLPFHPTTAILNYAHALNQASIDFQTTLKDIDDILGPLGNTSIRNLSVKRLPDSTLLHIRQHLVAPDSSSLAPSFQSKQNSYWTIAGIFPDSFQATAHIFAPTKEHLLLYRPSPNHDWQQAPLYNRSGKLIMFYIQQGDFAFGQKLTSVIDSSQLSIQAANFKQGQLQIKLYCPKAQKLFIQGLDDEKQALFCKKTKAIKGLQTIHIKAPLNTQHLKINTKKCLQKATYTLPQ